METVFDQEVNDALHAPIYNCSIPFTDCKFFIMKYYEIYFETDKTAGSSKFITNFTNAFLSLQDSLFLWSKPEGASSLDKMSYRT